MKPNAEPIEATIGVHRMQLRGQLRRRGRNDEQNNARRWLIRHDIFCRLSKLQRSGTAVEYSLRIIAGPCLPKVHTANCSFFFFLSCFRFPATSAIRPPIHPISLQLRKVSSAGNRTWRSRCKRVDVAASIVKIRGTIRHLLAIRVIISFNDKPRVNYTVSIALIVARACVARVYISNAIFPRDFRPKSFPPTEQIDDSFSLENDK